MREAAAAAGAVARRRRRDVAPPRHSEPSQFTVEVTEPWTFFDFFFFFVPVLFECVREKRKARSAAGAEDGGSAEDMGERGRRGERMLEHAAEPHRSARKSGRYRAGTAEGAAMSYSNALRPSGISATCSTTWSALRPIEDVLELKLTLLQCNFQNADRGGNGTSKNRIGTRGPDKVVQVPVGTVVHLVDGEAPFVEENRCSHALQPWEIPDELDQQPSGEASSSSGEASSSSGDHQWRSVDEIPSPEPSSSDELGPEQSEEEIKYSVAELLKPGQRIVVARGGEGGLGSYSSGKASKPPENTSVSGGGAGSEATLIVELKSIAEVGLVGMPNAGKSTLLGAISRAKPVVGDYPFTTLRPNIGNVEYDDFVSVTVADIPGIIRGAHENRGLGHAFLRHIERTKVLAYVVDLAAAPPPWEQLTDLVEELERHQEGMAARPSLVAANKVDVEGAEEVAEELRRRVRGVPVFAVSAVLEEGVEELKAALRSLVDGGGVPVGKILVD